MSTNRRGASLPPRLELAPVWRRAAAGLINLAIVITALLAFAAGGGLIGAAAFGLGRTRPFAPLSRWLAPRVVGLVNRLDLRERARRASERPRRLVMVPGLMLELDGRNRRGWGARVMAIRRVDARTGGPITVPAALARHVVSNAYGVAATQLLSPISTRAQAKQEAIRPQLHELQRAHADDPKALQAATTKLYRQHDINLFESCFAPLLAAAVVPMLTVWLSPRRQTLADRAAGILTVIDDRRPRTSEPR